MLCAIYKCAKKEGAYLYLSGRDKFELVPDALLALMGSLTLVTVLDLNGSKPLIGIDKKKLKLALMTPGYFFKLPPPPMDNLAMNKELMSEINASK